MSPPAPTPQYAFWDIDFRLVIKKSKTQKVSLTFPSYLPQGSLVEKNLLKGKELPRNFTTPVN